MQAPRRINRGYVEFDFDEVLGVGSYDEVDVGPVALGVFVDRHPPPRAEPSAHAAFHHWPELQQAVHATPTTNDGLLESQLGPAS